uniref:LuxR C-terminal-related transcriptional regulator n=1 Tax=Cryobacterium sp. TaxID=1926290 RepID=UPI001597D6EC|nr:LuxR C-terminal-related transcriptional regulator [Cryobacterium sp.]QJS06161.1 transcritpional regulator [Cryobacterium sp.]
MAETPDIDALAKTRQRSRQYRRHLDFLADNYVDQALVKAAILAGLSQTEIAKALGMSKKTVNTHARYPWRPYAAGKGMNLPDSDAFYRFVWGSDTGAADAIATCKQYDRERLDFEFTAIE